jgi:hypothetical protein
MSGSLTVVRFNGYASIPRVTTVYVPSVIISVRQLAGYSWRASVSLAIVVNFDYVSVTAVLVR